jgi:hypothetical protein
MKIIEISNSSGSLNPPLVYLLKLVEDKINTMINVGMIAITRVCNHFL